MQQHPIPQNVTQYQFRLVGDMTLKQFLELAGGLLLAYLFYASNLIFLFKWPLALGSVFFGLALAFFPLEDRPLDQWIINFVRAIYGPTRYVWKKTDKVPEIFLFLAHTIIDTPTAVKTLKAPALSRPGLGVSDLSPEEAKQIQSVDSLFQEVRATPATAPVPATEAPAKPAVTIRKLKSPAPATPPTHAPVPAAAPLPAAKLENGDTARPSPVDVIFSRPTVASAPPAASSAPLTTIKLPAAPSSPNLITGIVVDGAGRLVEGAIVQVVSGDGIPARAMKTNGLGQFFTTTPLASGTYAIEVEKEGLRFAAQSLVTNGAIIPPILLRASI